MFLLFRVFKFLSIVIKRNCSIRIYIYICKVARNMVNQNENTPSHLRAEFGILYIKTQIVSELVRATNLKFGRRG